jgi:hypothetical protein
LMNRKTDYIFRPKRSSKFYALFQYTDAMVAAGVAPKRRVEISLGTPCPHEARVKAAPYVAEHLRKVWEYQNRRKGDWKITYAMPLHKPGATFMNDQGEQVVATADDGLLVLSKDGVRRESNTVSSRSPRHSTRTGVRRRRSPGRSRFVRTTRTSRS